MAIEEAKVSISEKTLQALLRTVDKPTDREALSLRTISELTETMSRLNGQIDRQSKGLEERDNTISRLNKELSDAQTKNLEILHLEEFRQANAQGLALKREQGENVLKAIGQIVARLSAAMPRSLPSSPGSTGETDTSAAYTDFYGPIAEIVRVAPEIVKEAVNTNPDVLIPAAYTIVCRLPAATRQALLDRAPGAIGALLTLIKQQQQQQGVQ